MKSVKNVKDVEFCTGCGLCESLCPRRAITMQINEDGFLSPHIDVDACTNCGVCLAKCIMAAPEQEKPGEQDKPETYGAWHKNAAIQGNSSSGGVFTAIAEFILSKGGCVFGVRWINKLHASFVCINSADELAELRGSKYVPAHTDHVYRKISDELKKGRPVLFAGTSCQVYALRTFLRKPYDNLYTMDIVCHGMPSHLAFRKYIEEYETLTGNTIKQVDFRKKIISWQQYSVVRTTTDGTQAQVKYTDDDFMRLFLSDCILNKPCYNCPFITNGRQGDLSAGDFWGIQRYHKEWPLDKGISVVLANSAKGRELLKAQQDDLQLHSVTTGMIERGAVHTIPFRKYPRKPLPDQRATVLSWLKAPEIPLSRTINRFLGKRPVTAMLMNDKNVGILGFWYGLNYGAVLTSYALYKQIETLGYRPTLIDCSGFPRVPESNRDEQ
ncbi:MAG: Coenzyme F420 hydrogenase/dehydrogenase, beta subunit C-terminal domain [Akkermansia sp.]|nr:Coenzyme F420 hydrogenase/dehydrogenase, beta subunit C-terminal domain [Akkermansia sp.]